MAEQTDILTNPVLQKKIDGYRVDNFAVPQELTVTITLSEYRELVTTKAVCDSKVSEATQARWKVEKERDDLRTTLTEVKDTLERVRNDLSVANNRNDELKKTTEMQSSSNAELLKEKEKLSLEVTQARKQRDEAISQLEKLRSPSLTPVKKSKK
jgi:chromosome segregation ATPase